MLTLTIESKYRHQPSKTALFCSYVNQSVRDKLESDIIKITYSDLMIISKVEVMQELDDDKILIWDEHIKCMFATYGCKVTVESVTRRELSSLVLIAIDENAEGNVTKRMKTLENIIRDSLQYDVVTKNTIFELTIQEDDKYRISKFKVEFSGLVTKKTTIRVFPQLEKIPIDKVKMLNFEPIPNPNKKPIINPDISFDNIGGHYGIIDEIKKRVIMPRLFSNNLKQILKFQQPKGILLYGPPGTGKTLIAKTLSELLNAESINIVNGSELFSSKLGNSEKKLMKLFRPAMLDQAKYGDDSNLHVIVFDEIDAMTKTRSSSPRTILVNMLLTIMDGLFTLNNILLIGTTNRKDKIDSALLRPGRFELLLEVKLPTKEERFEIFNIHLKNLINAKMLDDDVKISQLVELTDGYSGADIAGIIRRAISLSLESNDDYQIIDKVHVKMEHLLCALKTKHKNDSYQHIYC